MVRTRIAPSPTGFPHLGTIYQAMFDFVFARKFRGKFVIRIEDTDRNRLVEGAEEVIFNSLNWFGLIADEDPIKGGEFAPYRSSQRLDIYHKYVQELLDKGHAYHCFCTKERLEEMRKQQEAKKLPPMYDEHCLNLSEDEIKSNLAKGLPFVVRMKIPENRKIKFTDAILGEIEFDSNLIDHQVILKADKYPTYHLAVVVDDYLMKITHVFRGQEWVPSTPKHILLYEFFGWENEIPQFVHLPVILNTEGGGKLSKRHGHASADYYKKEGYLPEAVLNYLSNIVWNHPEGKEIYPIEELGLAFHLNEQTKKLEHIEIYSQGPKFDLKKLEWINGEYIREISDEELTERLDKYLSEVLSKDINRPSKEQIGKLVPLIKTRIKKLSEFIPLTAFLFEEVEYDINTFERVKVVEQKQVLEKVLEILEAFKKPWEQEEFERIFREMAEKMEIKVGDLFQLIRMAFSGQLVTPPIFESMKFFGEDKTIERIKKATFKYPNF